jgi:hypothetical protein
MRRILDSMALLILVLVSTGCGYMRNRGNDLLDVVDIGLTFSAKPQFSAYVNAPFVALEPIGYGNVDAKFVGIGGGKASLWSPHFERSAGLLLWGQEELTFERTRADLAAMKSTEEQREATEFHQVGVLGMILGWSGVHGPAAKPKDLFACPHYLHLGWIGAVGTARYWQMLDFVVGWTTLDITSDDNRWEKKK